MSSYNATVPFFRVHYSLWLCCSLDTYLEVLLSGNHLRLQLHHDVMAWLYGKCPPQHCFCSKQRWKIMTNNWMDEIAKASGESNYTKSHLLNGVILKRDANLSTGYIAANATDGVSFILHKSPMQQKHTFLACRYLIVQHIPSWVNVPVQSDSSQNFLKNSGNFYYFSPISRPSSSFPSIHHLLALYSMM